MSRRSRLPSLLLSLALLALLLAGCRERVVTTPARSGGFQPVPRVLAGEPRSFLLGFSALPARLDDRSYVEALDLAANYGEVVLIQRAPEWESFMPGASVSAQLERTTISERNALAERGLKLLYAIDVFDPASRGQLAALPARHEGDDLSDAELRRAFVQHARFVALNYKPEYLALGVEVNAAFELEPEGYQAYREAYREAYDEVKAASPSTVVFATFQYEQLLGLVPWEPPHAPRWELLKDFEGRMDAFAITTYPSFVFPVARKVPAEYYSQIRAHTPLPILFASVGYSSAPAREGLNSSTTAEQRRFLGRLLGAEGAAGDADALRAPVVIWFAGRDPEFAKAPPLDLLASIGLRSSEDAPKEAWPTWEQAVNRPYDANAPERVAGG